MKYSQTCIERSLKGTWKCGLYEQLSFKYWLKLYALYMNEEIETVICYTEVFFNGCLTVLYKEKIDYALNAIK